MNIEERIAELVEFTGQPIELVQERMKYATLELAYLWPKYKGHVLDFYRENDLYLFDLAGYHQYLEDRKVHLWFETTVSKTVFKKMLDFGGGNGDWFMHALAGGATDVTYLDVDGVMKNFATSRFLKRGLTVNIVKEDAVLDEKYDAIIAFDVFEHLENPEPVIKDLASRTNFLFCNPGDIQYNFLYPCHVSRFDLTPYFTQLDQYLWINKNHSLT